MSDTTLNETPLQNGVEIIRDHVKNLPVTPGVYRMIDTHDNVLYVGKAKALKKRVASYTRPHALPIRLQRMIATTTRMEFVHTQTEEEALLLESNLIKTLKPRYNILLRDDKSFAYLLITGDHDYPLVTKHRGAKKRKGKYFGPYPSAGDVNRTLTILQRVFQVRNCSDSIFANRSRPCLQYHIKRCSAPCVGIVTKDEYGEQIAQARDFLNGKSKDVQNTMTHKMELASKAQEYETAALYRDRIKTLASIQAHQDINLEGLINNADVIALHKQDETAVSCVQVFFFRNGRNNGNRPYFINHSKDDNNEEIISAFIAQFYSNKPPPHEIIVSHIPKEKQVLTSMLSDIAERGVTIIKPQRGKKVKLLTFALRNAKSAMDRYIAKRTSQEKLLKGVADLFELEHLPNRIETYDNSHISGTNMTGAMVVAGPEGFVRNAYRKYNIREAAAADDTGMMREVLHRRFKNARTDIDTGALDKTSIDWPDIVLIDGGRGQYNAARKVLKDLAIENDITLVSIAKGEDRHAGRETFFVDGKTPFQLPENNPVLHYLQQLRDEAHRFVIGAHRTRRKKDISDSPLDRIAGVGAIRKRALLNYFGSAKAVKNAAVEDLQKIDGISNAMAQAIYDHFH